MKGLASIATILFVIVALVVSTACGAKKASEGNNPGNENPSVSGTPVKGTATTLLVTVKNMTFEKFEHFFQVNGSVEAVHDAFISSEINGQIKTIHVKEGQRVKENQLLISLNAEVIESSIAEVKSALELAETVYKKRKGLWDKEIGSEIQYLEAKTNRDSLASKLKTLEAQLKMTKIKAPIDGIVDEIFKKEGELAVPGLQLIQLVNLKKVYINADVSETYLARLEKGDTALVTFPSYPELTFDAAIYRTGNVVKSKNRTFLVQLLLENKEEKLKPNMMALIKMKDIALDSALVVPSIIIKNDLKGSYLYVIDTQEKKGKTVARKTYVEPGISQGSDTLVTQGLEPGQQVIIKGYNLVKNGMEVKIKS